MDSVVPPGLSLVSVLSLLACSIQVLAAALLTLRYGGRSSAEDRWILLWLFYDVIVHLTLVRPIWTSFICLHSVMIWMFCHCFLLFVLRRDRLSTCLWLFIVCCLSSGGTVCLHVSGRDGGDIRGSAGWTLWVCLLSYPPENQGKKVSYNFCFCVISYLFGPKKTPYNFNFFEYIFYFNFTACPL